MTTNTVIIRNLGLQDYHACWLAMQHFTNTRDETTLDEIWILEHPSVYTQGQSGKPEHILNPGNIPIIQSDRGGQVTYHGPGQLVIYIMVDLKRKKLNVRSIVTIIENSVIELLNQYGIKAETKCDAPGVYVNGEKICSLGLRIRRGCSFHGLALNVKTDLEPFSRINPCGYADLKITQIYTFKKDATLPLTAAHLLDYLIKNLRYTDRQEQDQITG